MRVSVVVCTYAPELYDDFREAAASVREQTYDDVELVVVVDGTDAVCERVRSDFGDADDVRIHCNEENRGLSASRNAGAELATGDVLAFMDDDAVADEDWVAALVAAYEDRDAIAVGGRMAPRWVAGEPAWLPEEFHWLVGVTHRGFADGPGEVRNTFGSNISFRRDVFEDLDGFDPAFGLAEADTRTLQSEETELAARMRARFGRGVYYTPEAVVEHKVFAHRTDPVWLLKRAFWQGYSKRAMAVAAPEETADTETAFLRALLTRFIPDRIARLPTDRWRGAAQLIGLVGLTAAVGVGYLYGMATWR